MELALADWVCAAGVGTLTANSAPRDSNCRPSRASTVRCRLFGGRHEARGETEHASEHDESPLLLVLGKRISVATVQTPGRLPVFKGLTVASQRNSTTGSRPNTDLIRILPGPAER